MIELQCSWCGFRARHIEAGKFIKEGWRKFGGVSYCPKCIPCLKKIDTDKYSMALWLLNKLSSDVSEMQKEIRHLQKQIDNNA